MSLRLLFPYPLIFCLGTHTYASWFWGLPFCWISFRMPWTLRYTCLSPSSIIFGSLAFKQIIALFIITKLCHFINILDLLLLNQFIYCLYIILLLSVFIDYKIICFTFDDDGACYHGYVDAIAFGLEL